MAARITTVPLGGSIDLLMRLGLGAVTVTARDDLTDATVRLQPRRSPGDILDRFTVELDGSTLRVVGPRQGGLAEVIGGWRRDRCAVDVEVEVPTGTPVEIASAGQRISLVGRFGDTDVATGAAQVDVDDVTGNLRLRCARAETRVAHVTGSVQLHAGACSAHFVEVGGGLECGFGHGELVVDVVRGSVRSRAGSGAARVGEVHGDVDLAFGSGPISVGFPSGVSAHVDVTSGSGEVHSDLPIESGPASAGRSITVRARTGSGEVRLLRAAA